MEIINLGHNNSVLNNYMAQIRDKKIQKDSMRFRTNMRRIGALFAYEISKTFSYSEKQVQTPLGIAAVPTCDDKLVLATILRAGLPIHEGMLSVFDNAESAFITTYRKYGAGKDFTVNTEYCNTPSLEGKILLICDPMIATGLSMIEAYHSLTAQGGEPIHTHFVCPIVSADSVDELKKSVPANCSLWMAAVDEELTGRAFVVPGLGDAGDLAYGAKL